MTSAFFWLAEAARILVEKITIRYVDVWDIYRLLVGGN